jgi:ribose transport system ATP-binding protein
MSAPGGIPSRLRMRGIRKTFGSTVALGRVDLDILPGEVHALVGENGAGKSTLMKVLSGAHAPDEGDMLLDGQPYRPRDPLEARSRGVGMIYQELSLAPHLTVEENIVLGLEPTRGGVFVDRALMRQRAREALQQFDHPDIRPDRPAGELSVSAQQLVEIARSLAMGCRVLVFDEPTSSLTQSDIQRLFDLIRRLRDQGMSIIYISHFLEEVRALASRLTVLRDGSAVGTHETSAVTDDDIVKLMVGRDVEDLYPRSARTPGETLLTVRELGGKRFPVTASLELRRGEVVGICGLVGSGRTELLRTVFGLDPVRRGDVSVRAISSASSPSQRWAQGVGFLSENRKEEGLTLGLSIADNVTLPSLGGLGRFGMFRPSVQATRTRRWIDRLGIKCRGPAEPIGRLSGGNQQKGALARLLESESDVLLLDEPTRGIDIAAKATIYQVMDDLVTDPQRPRAVLMVSSYLPELFGVCDRIAVMSRGVLSAARPVSELDAHTVMTVATGKE